MPGTTRTDAGTAPTKGLMRAIGQRGYGSADVLHAPDVAIPAVGDDEVLVEVRAAGLDRGTWHLMAGVPYGTDLPWVLLHLINETARHAGHADATRELLDGAIGE